MSIDKTTFFAYARRSPFGNRLTPEQVEGLEQILAAWDKFAGKDLRHIAYILATAFHETGGRMQPVREGFAKSDAAARKVVANRAYGKEAGKYKHVYYGRGYVQLTWYANYERVGKLLGLPLLDNPDLALDPDISARILVEGMMQGMSRAGDFTGKAVEDYFNDTVDDPVNARKVVNKLDKAELIASYYRQFLRALQAADTATPLPADVNPEAAKADAPALTTDKTVIGALTSIVGAGGAGLLGAVNNPWALGAVAIVGIGVLLLMTGRLEIRRKAGA